MRDGELADVVQARAEPQLLEPLAGQAEPPADGDGELRHAIRVAAGVRVAPFHRPRQRCHRPHVRTVPLRGALSS